MGMRLIVLALIALSVVGCQSGSPSLAGCWDDGAYVRCFNQGGTGTYRFYGANANAPTFPLSWNLAGNRLTVVEKNGYSQSEANYTISISGDTLSASSGVDASNKFGWSATWRRTN